MSDEPNAAWEECPCCGGLIYSCLACGFETPRLAELEDHECESAAPVDTHRETP